MMQLAQDRAQSLAFVPITGTKPSGSSKIRTHRTVMLLVVLFGCETWSSHSYFREDGIVANRRCC